LRIFRKTVLKIQVSLKPDKNNEYFTRRADCSPLSTGILYGLLQTVTIPEVVIIQFVLLRMRTVLLETCWGL